MIKMMGAFKEERPGINQQHKQQHQQQNVTGKKRAFLHSVM